MTYDTFSEIYDAVMQDYSWCSDFLEKQLSRYRGTGASVLEIGCGTGRILELTAGYFQRLTGLDLNPSMLQHASERLPDASFHCLDMREFSLGETFDVILCLYDTMNHLRDLEEWQQTFRQVRRHLRPYGRFIFDMNTASRLSRLALFPPLVRGFSEKDLMIMEVEELEPDSFALNTTFFCHEQGDKYFRKEEIIKEYTPQAEQVIGALSELFRSVSIFDEDGDEASSLEEAENGRLFFVCS